MGKTKKDTNTRLAGQRNKQKNVWQSKCTCINYILMGLNESDVLLVSDSSLESLSTSVTAFTVPKF